VSRSLRPYQPEPTRIERLASARRATGQPLVGLIGDLHREHDLRVRRSRVLVGRVVAATGTLHAPDDTDLHTVVRRCGGQLEPIGLRSVNTLVVGSDPEASDLRQAADRELLMINNSGLLTIYQSVVELDVNRDRSVRAAVDRARRERARPYGETPLGRAQRQDEMWRDIEHGIKERVEQKGRTFEHRYGRRAA
jgi:hypothetical protein